MDGTGRAWMQPGEIIILGAYTFQNVRLLLHSGITGGGQVGKYFINRAGPTVRAVFPDTYLNGYTGPTGQSQSVDDFNAENAAEEKLALPADDFFVRGGLLFCSAERHPLVCYRDIPPGVPRWGSAYKTYLRENLNRYMAAAVLAEALPYASSTIDLDPVYRDRYGVPAARVTRQVKRNEIRMARFLYEKAAGILRAAGASHVWGSQTPVPVASSNHDVGGCRMGTAPDRSVTNRFCQVWEVPNVFIAGGAVFPSLSGHNPTETMWALAFLGAEAIVKNQVNLSDAGDHRSPGERTT